MRKTQEIRETLVALLARSAGVPPESIEPDASVWEHFPLSGTAAEHPSITSVVDHVHATFDVYLTEEEWENPTLEDLVRSVEAKHSNPEKSTADWQREQSETRKGGRFAFVLLNLVLGPAAFFSSNGSPSRRGWVTLGILLFMNAMLLLVYRSEARRWRSKPGAKPSSSRP